MTRKRRTPVPDAALKRAAQENFKKISSSDTFCVLFNEEMVEEVLPLLQMGLAIYLDKPIVLLIPKGATVPANLRQLAVASAEFDPDDPTTSLEGAARQVLNLTRT